HPRSAAHCGPCEGGPHLSGFSLDSLLELPEAFDDRSLYGSRHRRADPASPRRSPPRSAGEESRLDRGAGPSERADRTQEADDELETVLKVLLLSSEARVSSGKGGQVELLRAQASLVQPRSNRESALDHKRSAWARLASLLDRNPAGPAGPTLPPSVL